MIIKSKDKAEVALKQLEEIQNIPSITRQTRTKVEREIQIIKKGLRGEKDSAYYIDFYFGDSKNWAIIHDLRIEHKNLVAQIDHLLINRFLDFYILETKNYTHGIKINDRGEFLVWTGKQYTPIESPIEQNQRHIEVMKRVLETEPILPKRAGIKIQSSFFSYILVSPKSRVIRPEKKIFDSNLVIKSDELNTKLEQNIENKNTFSSLVSLTKLISQDSLVEIANKVASYHRPTKIDYYKKFNINISDKKIKDLKIQKKSPQKTKYYCFKCSQTITNKVASFCFSNKNRFQGKAYCYTCQRLFTS